ncbi:putative nitrogen fixation protein [Thioflavicoccus mobilis 8321]|uniref:Putative nitrogen fixation protein n=1 Tax=Thioflavicoccus mobilis 8321 TaxID=765912 RepID=L0H3P8_9GAMM|nr:NifX-associated nitrogen fixation protein [Thioflavicoccus mobilis]AGA92300.1 putative nitrogen fixation protein [Thioflavicoccus mobilis 8321]
MQDEQLAIAEGDPVLQSSFAAELVRQMRAIDSYGTSDSWPANKVLDPFILTKERLRELPLVGDPDEIVIARIQAFYNAIAAQIEQECGLQASPIISLSHEGFGRALMIVGKLVVMDRALRDVHRFGFPSPSKMKDEADKLLSVALEIIGDHPQVAGL